MIVSQVLSWGHVCQKSTYLWHGWIIALRFITGHLHGRSFVSNHRKSYCLFTTLFRLTTKKSPKLCVIDALWVESTGNPTPPPPPSVIRKVYACHDITILHGNCFCLIVTQWRQHKLNTDSTKPLPESVLIYHQWCPVTITCLRGQCISHQSLNLAWKLHF